MRLELNSAQSPVLRWSRIFGIPAEITRQQRLNGSGQVTLVQRFTSKSSAAICLIFYLLNVGGNIAFLASINETSVPKSTTRTWNFNINRTNYSFATIAIHSTLLFRSCIRWPTLRRMFSSWESSNKKLSQRNYHQLRRFSITCSLFVLLVH